MEIISHLSTNIISHAHVNFSTCNNYKFHTIVHVVH